MSVNRFDVMRKTVQPHEEVSTTPKRKRTRLVQAELWLMLASAAEHITDYSTEAECQRIKYGLSEDDFKRLLKRMADTLENMAEKCGYADHWDDTWDDPGLASA